MRFQWANCISYKLYQLVCRADIEPGGEGGVTPMDYPNDGLF